jgi:hypothetical protein
VLPSGYFAKTPLEVQKNPQVNPELKYRAFTTELERFNSVSQQILEKLV